VPGAGPFDDPAARRTASGRRHDFSAVAHVGNIPSGMDRDLDLAGIIPLVQAQVLRLVRRGPRPTDDDPVQGLRSDLHVMTIRGRHHHGQRGPALIGQRVAFGAAFAPIRRIRACRRPPNGALTIALSNDCHFHWMPRTSSGRSSTTVHSFSEIPVWTQVWNRRWHVEPDPYSRGRAFHWQPVRRTYKMPSITWRKGTTGRPGVPGGFSGESRGSSSAHKSSGMGQIVRRCRCFFSVVVMFNLCGDEGAITGHEQYTGITEMQLTLGLTLIPHWWKGCVSEVCPRRPHPFRDTPHPPPELSLIHI